MTATKEISGADIRPARDEAAPYYFTYIDLVAGTNILAALEAQLGDTLSFVAGISEEKSRHRYAPDKWSIRQVLGHVNDTERLFVWRAFWFARGFTTPLPSFDQNSAVAAARSDEVSWTQLIDEFRAVRPATIAFFRNLPTEAWSRSGTASDKVFTVRALAYLAVGHVAHHLTIVRERYL